MGKKSKECSKGRSRKSAWKSNAKRSRAKLGQMARGLLEVKAHNAFKFEQLMIAIQSNLVITNSTGPSIFVRFCCDIVITVKVCVLY